MVDTGSHANGTAAGGNGTSHGGNSTQPAGHGGITPAMAAMFAKRQKVTEQQMRYFAAGICGLMAVFVLLHWTRYLFGTVARRSSSSPFVAPFAAVTRAVRRLLIRKVPRFNSGGHALTVTIYVAINCAVLFTNVDLKTMSSFAARAGWLTACNMALVVFLALKNTPLAFLTAYSYERLNCLHQVAGCLTFLLMVMHAACYTSYFASRDKLSILREKEQIAGIICGFAFLSVTLSALILRRIWYELFYVTHIMFFIVGIVSVCFHQPTFGHKIVILLFSTAAMWVVDRLVRVGRAAYYMTNNTATIYPLPNGGTKVVMAKVPARAVPGKHLYVWIPHIRMFEMHPFTIVGTQPLEFIIKSHNGFTRDLRIFAEKNPGAALRASVDGPYGTFPDPMEYDKVVLVAGGGGASFTFGLAVNLLERMKEGSNKSIAFIWTVKQHDNISWFTQHLSTLQAAANKGMINTHLFVTRAPVDGLETLDHHHHLHLPGHHHKERDESTPQSARQDRHDRTLPTLTTTSSSTAPSTTSTSTSPTDTEKPSTSQHSSPTISIPSSLEKELQATTQAALKTAGNRSSVIVESSMPTTPGDRRGMHKIASGRPDTAQLIREAVLAAGRGERVLVAACGPDSLLTVVRDTTAKLIRGDGPAVELHCESFGW